MELKVYRFSIYSWQFMHVASEVMRKVTVRCVMVETSETSEPDRVH